VEKQLFERSELADPAGLSGTYKRRTAGDKVKIVKGKADQLTVLPARSEPMGNVPGVVDRHPVSLEDRCPLTEARRP
jgi:hypothetical protein